MWDVAEKKGYLAHRAALYEVQLLEHQINKNFTRS